MKERKTKIIPIIIAITIITLTIVSIKINTENKELRNEIMILENDVELKMNQIKRLEADNIAAKEINEEIKNTLLNIKNNYEKDVLPKYLTIDLLKSKGIDDYNSILKDLVNQSKLIKYDGVFGGRMQFVVEDSKLLNEKYVFAYFEDGHIAGYALLKYKINDEFKVEWSLVDSYLIE